jgi:hypothetical protein
MSSLKDSKYRIALSLPQIHYLVALLRTDTREATAKMSDNLASQLKLLAFKAEEGITSPAYTAAEKQSIEQKLGLDDPSERRERAYAKWQGNPALCSAQEVADAMLYRYESDMMTTAEEQEYERNQ